MSYLIKYGKILKEKILLKPVIGIIEDYKIFDINYFRNIINIDDYEYDIVKKEQSTGYKMNWHLDGANLKKHKIDIIDKYVNENNIKISEKYILHYYIKKPIYTLIVYESNYNIDFTGGTLEFLDNIIIPYKGLYVFFDSNELHKVNIMKGTRINYLVKFYSK